MTDLARAVVAFRFLLALTPAACTSQGETDFRQALEASRQELGRQYGTSLHAFTLLGLTSEKLALLTPDIGAGTVALYGEDTGRSFNRERVGGSPKALGDRILDVVNQGAGDDTDDLARGLVMLGRTTQSDAAFNQPLARFSYLSLGYRLEHLVCLKGLGGAADQDLQRCERSTPRATAAKLVVPTTEQGQGPSSSAQSLLSNLDMAASAQAGLDADLANLMDLGTLPPDSVAGMNGAAKSSVDGILASAPGCDLADPLLRGVQQMQEGQMSFNLQYLQLQNGMQNENRQFTMVSSIMKTKHDTVKNSIGNIR